jgi:hypothetical protein
MNRSLTGFSLILVLALGLFSTPLLAHHAFSAEFDRNKPVKLEGTVKRVEWMNPHIWFYVDVKDAAGKVTTWGFSGGPPGQLARRGITKEALKPGDHVKVEGFQAKNGTNNASGGNVTFADGKAVFAGSAEDVVPGR